MPIPKPRIDQESKPFWEACERQELYLQRCRDCGVVRYYIRALCPECLSGETEWLRSSGRGTVYTFTVTHQNQAEGFRDQLPYVLAYVELEEGVRMLTGIVDCPPDQVRIGMAVIVKFEAIDGAVIPKFAPAPSQE